MSPKIKIKHENDFYMLDVPEDKQHLFKTKGIEKLNLDEVRGVAEVLDRKIPTERKETRQFDFKLPSVNPKPVLVVIGVITLLYVLAPLWYYVIGVVLTFGMLWIPSTIKSKEQPKHKSFLLDDIFDKEIINQDEALKHKYASLRGLMKKLPFKN